MNFEYEDFKDGIIPIVNGERMTLTYLNERYTIDMDMFRDHILSGLGYFIRLMDEPQHPCVVYLKDKNNIEEFEQRYLEKITLFTLGGLKKEKRKKYGMLEWNVRNK